MASAVSLNIDLPTPEGAQVAHQLAMTKESSYQSIVRERSLKAGFSERSAADHRPRCVWVERLIELVAPGREPLDRLGALTLIERL